MVYDLRRQPFKALYRAFHSLKFWLLDFPVRALLYVVPRFRPRPSWPYVQSLVIPRARLWSEFGPVAYRTGPLRSWPTHTAISHKDGATGVWIEPSTAALSPQILSWAEAGSVSPVQIPGYWETATGPGEATPAAPGEKVIYHFHGGGYISESAHPSEWMAALPRTLLQRKVAPRALLLEYRLTDIDPKAPQDARNPFPAALIDAIAGYVYLVDTLGFAPENIILSGDSAGGHLALSLARYIAENTSHLATALKAFEARTSPPDYRMVLFSPWADMGTSHDFPGGSERECHYDFLGDPLTGVISVVTKVMSQPLGQDAVETSAYLSPASRHTNHSFKGFPRTFIVVGGAERFRDQNLSLRDKMLADGGEKRVASYVHADGFHDYLLTLFDEPERQRTWTAITQWLEN